MILKELRDVEVAVLIEMKTVWRVQARIESYAAVALAAAVARGQQRQAGGCRRDGGVYGERQ